MEISLFSIMLSGIILRHIINYLIALFQASCIITRTNSRTCLHNDQARRIVSRQSSWTCNLTCNVCETFKRQIHTVGQQRNLERKEELPCRVIKIATATAIVVVIDSDQPQPRHVYQITILHTRVQHLPLHSINTQATNKQQERVCGQPRKRLTLEWYQGGYL